jgi:cytochrome b involved in lipid metabolism
MSEAGKDATEAFEDVGHSDDARGLLKNMLVGAIEGGVSHCIGTILEAPAHNFAHFTQVKKAKSAAAPAVNQAAQQSSK